MSSAQQTGLTQGPRRVGRGGFQLGTITIIVLTAALFLVLTVTSTTFMSYSNIYTILYGLSIEFFAVIGFTYLMIMGEIDLSVGSVYGFAGTLLGVLMLNDLPLLPALLITLAASAGFGFLNGFLVTRFRLNSLMVTIGSMTLIKGVNWVLIRSLFGRTYPSEFRGLARASLGDINVTVILMIALVIVLEILLRRTTPFRKLYYVGENIQTAKIYGLPAERIKVVFFTLSALAAAVGGILANSRITHADVTTGDGLEFKVLTAAVLGGASLFGGKGSVMNSVIGLLFLATVLNGMIIFKIEPLLQQFVVGVILIVSVFIDTRLNREKLG